MCACSLLLSFISMATLCDRLILQTTQEARDALRHLVSALNGLAAIFIIKEEVDVNLKYELTTI